MDIYFKRPMKFFKGIKKLLHHLTRDEDQVSYEHFQEIVKQQPTSEQSNMETKIENHHLNQVREWAINKIELLHEADRHKNANSLLAEFDEWINIPDGVEELDYLCLEDQDWTDEQEIDIR